jgi:deazaflavin-dependent oxidoreductase (nitroreductase family)
MPTHNRDPNADVIAEFRASGGAVKADYDDPAPMLLLHTIGAKSSREHVTPMRAMVDGDAFYVFASAHGSPRNPDWYHNLKAQPEITIEVGGGSIPVRATEITGEERQVIFDRHADRFPIFAEYQRRLDCTIPVIRLDRRGA